MDFLIGFLTVLEVLVCILLTLIILMQRPRQEGLGAAFGGGMMDSLAGAQTTNVLQKGTTYLGGMLFILSAILAILLSHQTSGGPAKKSLVPEASSTTAPAAAPSLPAPSEPAKTPEAPAPSASKPADTKPAAPAPSATTPPASAPATQAPATKPAASTPPPAAPTGVIPVPTTPPVPPPAPAPNSEPAKP
jgi:preprotein translocase subunit SecG